MRNSGLFLLFILFPLSIHAGEVIELATFPEVGDEVIQRCYEQAMAATKQGKVICEEQGFGDFWVCPPSKEMRLKPLEQCKADAPKAKDEAAMLYLLGLLHQDFHYKPHGSGCPEFYRFQEGSAVCVYKSEHFERLMEKFPESKYSDMAAFKQAEAAYRYYECEGRTLCSIENAIAGWIQFLEKKTTSDFAGMAKQKIVEALDRLSDTTLDPKRESATGLLADIRDLRVIATGLSPENRADLVRSLDSAEVVLTGLQRVHQGTQKQ